MKAIWETYYLLFPPKWGCHGSYWPSSRHATAIRPIWWPSEIWAWSMVSNWKNGPDYPATEQFPTITSFFKECVRRCFAGNLVSVNTQCVILDFYNGKK